MRSSRLNCKKAPKNLCIDLTEDDDSPSSINNE